MTNNIKKRVAIYLEVTELVCFCDTFRIKKNNEKKGKQGIKRELKLNKKKIRCLKTNLNTLNVLV